MDPEARPPESGDAVPPPEEFAYEDLAPKKNWVDETSWYLMVMGFIGILLSGLCFFLYRNRPLRYEDFSLDANVLGKYLLLAGLTSYMLGRAIYYYRRFRSRKARR
jgi:hypothetical protein